MEFVAWRE